MKSAIAKNTFNCNETPLFNCQIDQSHIFICPVTFGPLKWGDFIDKGLYFLNASLDMDANIEDEIFNLIFIVSFHI